LCGFGCAGHDSRDDHLSLVPRVPRVVVIDIHHGLLHRDIGIQVRLWAVLFA
jgi:hypothetical protein